MKLKLLSVIAVLASSTVYAQTVEVRDAWVRASVPGQTGTGAFMTLRASEGAKLVGASSPAAAVTEVHEMKMEGDVMKMRALAGDLDLPAGKTVRLQAGGYHLMLMGLKTALPKGSTVPLTLVFRYASGLQASVLLKVPVAAVAPGGQAADKAAMTGHEH